MLDDGGSIGSEKVLGSLVGGLERGPLVDDVGREASVDLSAELRLERGRRVGGERGAVGEGLKHVVAEDGRVTDADEQGRPASGGDDLVGEEGALEDESVGAVELLARGFDERDKVALLARGLLDVVHVLDQLGDDLGVRVRLKLVALGHEQLLEHGIVGDDAVVHDHKRVVGVRRVRVRVDVRRRAVRGPARVRDANVVVQQLRRRLGQARVLLGRLAQGVHLAHLFHKEQLGLRAVSVHGEARAVVAAVLETLKALEECVDDIALRLGRVVVEVGENSCVSEGVVTKISKFRFRLWLLFSCFCLFLSASSYHTWRAVCSRGGNLEVHCKMVSEKRSVERTAG